jgi:hypothetical protein
MRLSGCNPLDLIWIEAEAKEDEGVDSRVQQETWWCVAGRRSTSVRPGRGSMEILAYSSGPGPTIVALSFTSCLE